MLSGGLARIEIGRKREHGGLRRSPCQFPCECIQLVGQTNQNSRETAKYVCNCILHLVSYVLFQMKCFFCSTRKKKWKNVICPNVCVCLL